MLLIKLFTARRFSDTKPCMLVITLADDTSVSHSLDERNEDLQRKKDQHPWPEHTLLLCSFRTSPHHQNRQVVLVCESCSPASITLVWRKSCTLHAPVFGYVGRQIHWLLLDARVSVPLLVVPCSAHTKTDTHCVPETLGLSISSWVGLTGVGMRLGLCTSSLWSLISLSSSSSVLPQMSLASPTCAGLFGSTIRGAARWMSALLRFQAFHLGLRTTPKLRRHLRHHVVQLFSSTLRHYFLHRLLVFRLRPSSNVSPKMLLAPLGLVVGYLVPHHSLEAPSLRGSSGHRFLAHKGIN